MSPPLHRFDRLASTMDLVHQLAADGAEAGTAVVAAEQTGGRGSRGRAWSSPRGGLWLSVLFRPTSPDGLELMSLRGGLAVAESLEALGVAVGLKWPNDLMLGQAKVAGVLCESRWQGDAPGWLALGVGINVTNAVPAGQGRAAARLADRVPQATAEALLDPVLTRLRGLDHAIGSLTPEELARFAARDWLRGRVVEAPVAGVAAGLAADGALLVRREDGVVIPVRAGSVELAESPSPT